uniref:Vacuolar fusion protein MON1 homolog n=1 Tax=Strigamia maritima TaxID=126957 RepID=T1IV58_STRMM
MDDVSEIAAVEGDVPQDFEPGKSRHCMLVTTNSYDEIQEELETEQTPQNNERRSSTGSTAKELENISAGGDHSEETKLEETETQLCDLSVVTNFPECDESRETLNSDDDFEYIQSSEWRHKKKHIFILSEAGKPIYSHHGKEDKLVTLMGVIQALISHIQNNNDTLRSIISGKHKFVFLQRGPIILVAVSKGHESIPQLMMHLTYLYNQILCLLTHKTICHIFENRRNYDLRRLLSGVEKFLDNMLFLMAHEPSFLLGAVRCLPMESNIRENVSQIIVSSCSKNKDLVFAFLVAKNQLITLVRMKKYFIHPADLHVLFNLVNASESFKTAESWMPICLPKFDSNGFLHGHVSYIDDKSEVCLLLLSVDRDAFFQLSESKTKIVEKLKKQNILKAITESVNNDKYEIGQVGIADLRHFIYKSKSTAQYTSPELETPYVTQKEQERLFGLYLYLHQRIHSASRPLKMLFYVGEKETMLGWVTTGFELYTTFEPLVTKLVAINAVNKLLRWIKKEEEKLFILIPSVF